MSKDEIKSEIEKLKATGIDPTGVLCSGLCELIEATLEEIGAGDMSFAIVMRGPPGDITVLATGTNMDEKDCITTLAVAVQDMMAGDGVYEGDADDA